MCIFSCRLRICNKKYQNRLGSWAAEAQNEHSSINSTNFSYFLGFFCVILISSTLKMFILIRSCQFRTNQKRTHPKQVDLLNVGPVSSIQCQKERFLPRKNVFCKVSIRPPRETAHFKQKFHIAAILDWSFVLILTMSLNTIYDFVI